jgi:hypothetical protein
MITNTKILEKYCTDYKNIENYEEAVKSPLRYDLHHRREISENKSRTQLIAENLYYDRPATELIFIEAGEHIRLHNANLSEETRQKISEALKGKHPSAESRQKMSEAQKGKPRSPETRQKLSEAHKGKHHSEETKKKMSEVHRGRHWHLENGKRIYTD